MRARLSLNRFDCGMFMIKYADFYSRGLGLCFNQVNRAHLNAFPAWLEAGLLNCYHGIESLHFVLIGTHALFSVEDSKGDFKT